MSRIHKRYNHVTNKITEEDELALGQRYIFILHSLSHFNIHLILNSAEEIESRIDPNFFIEIARKIIKLLMEDEYITPQDVLLATFWFYDDDRSKDIDPQYRWEDLHEDITIQIKQIPQ